MDDMTNSDNPAHALLGRAIGSGWSVCEKVKRGEHQSGSNFSVGYIVEKHGERCFLKAFNFLPFLNFKLSADDSGEVNVIDALNEMTTAFKYERDLSKLCDSKRLTKIATVVEDGQVHVPGGLISVVPFLIFRLADGDVRSNLHYSEDLDVAWKLKSLHDVAVGLKQLHSIKVSHQDLKPSNV